jgi:hypothetical protein
VLRCACPRRCYFGPFGADTTSIKTSFVTEID